MASLVAAMLSGKPVPVELPGLDGIVFFIRYMTHREALKFGAAQRAKGEKTSLRNRTPEDEIADAETTSDETVGLLLDRTSQIDASRVPEFAKVLKKKAEMRKVFDMLPADDLTQLVVALSSGRKLRELFFCGDADAGDTGSEGSEGSAGSSGQDGA